jgi:hypothetical protein
MQINASFDFAADTSQAERTNFVNAVNTVIGYFDGLFTNDVTLNVKFALGEDFLSDDGTTITYERMANIDAPSGLLGTSATRYEIRDYTAVRNLLLAKTDTNQPAAYATLPTNSPFGNEKLVASLAQERQLGITPGVPGYAGIYDGVVGIISEEELAPGGNTADWTKAAPANANQYYMIGTIEHELTEVMGRFAWAGTSPFGNNVGPVYTIMDLFRYSSPGVRQLTNGDPAYFSIDGGQHYYYYWNTAPLEADQDFGDWIQVAPGGAPPGPDAFDLHEEPGVINEVSAFDLVNMNVLGWNLVPVVRHNPTPPAATTADMVLRHGADGFYEIYDIGNNAILAGYLVAKVGTDWQFAGLGGFFGTDTTDMLLRSATTGGFEVYDIANNNITNAAFLGAVGLNWQVMGFGNFSSLGETDMILRNANNGGVEVYDIRNNQITGANFMGAVGLDWQVAGFGNFSSRGTSDMILRNMNNGGLEVYDINNNQITGAAFMGTVGLDWKVLAFGDFSSRPGATDMIMRNANSGAMIIYDIDHDQITSASFIGAVGLDWQYAGVAPVRTAGESDLVLRNVNTGAFQVYDIANNAIIGTGSLGQVGLDWSLGGLAVDPPTGAIGGSDDSTSQLVQAMAGFAGGDDAAQGFDAAGLGDDASQQPFLTAPQQA